MMDTKDTDRKGKPLGLRGGAPRPSNVRQSFSHGRSKTVTVEQKRKRILGSQARRARPTSRPERRPRRHHAEPAPTPSSSGR